MAITTGRTIAVGLARDTTRGTSLDKAAQWIPRTTLSFNPTSETVTDPSNIGVLESSYSASNAITTIEASMDGVVRNDYIGHFLRALFSQDTVTTVRTNFKKHTFTLKQNALSDLYTLFINDTNGQRKSPGCVLSTLDINATVGEFMTFTSSWMGKDAIALDDAKEKANKVVYTAASADIYPLVSRNVDQVSYSITDAAGTKTTGKVRLRDWSLSFNKNIENDNRLGLRSPNDFITTGFDLTGSLTVVFDKDEFTKPFVESQKVTLDLKVNDNDTTPNEALTFSMPNVFINGVDTDYTNDSIVTQSIEFMALYDITATNCVTVSLTNKVAEY